MSRAFNQKQGGQAIAELIRRTATDLPPDVEAALRRAGAQEPPGSPAADTINTLLENVRIARSSGAPLCQDTGTPAFDVRVPPAYNPFPLTSCIRAALSRVTKMGFMRQNTITYDGASLADNLGRTTPIINWRPWRGKNIAVGLMLKGGGCENVSRQYSLPDRELDAGRDLEGVRRCVLDAVWRAQGGGCSPGILGVCVGGDRATGFVEAKHALWRKIGVRSDKPRLAELERRLLRETSTLGIGPMGLGGNTTLLDIKIADAERLPASFFVTVSYMCWACRRRSIILSTDGETWQWKP